MRRNARSPGRLLTVLIAVSPFACAGGLGAESLPVGNDCVRLDTDSTEIRCQGGSMMRLGDTWHWYGTDIEASKKNDSPLYHAVRCYTSKDLSRWKFERAVYITYAIWRTRQEANVGMMIAELSDDYLSVVRTVTKTETKLEASAIFKRNGTYYWMSRNT